MNAFRVIGRIAEGPQIQYIGKGTPVVNLVVRTAGNEKLLSIQFYADLADEISELNINQPIDIVGHLRGKEHNAQIFMNAVADRYVLLNDKDDKGLPF